jgi:DegV family protein with EDD domain
MKVGLVIDSSAAMSEKMLSFPDLGIIPLSVSFADKTYLSRDITLEELYSRVDATKILPTTSQPTPVAIDEVLKRFIDYDHVFLITISPSLSGTNNGVRSIVENYPNVKVFSCGGAASAHAYLCDLLIDKIYANEIEEAFVIAAEFAAKVKNIITPETLKHLVYGGRVNKNIGSISNALNIRMMLALEDESKPVLFAKVMGNKKMVKTLMNELKKNDVKLVYVTPFLTNTDEYNLIIKKLVDENIDYVECVPDSVMGSHFGRGTTSFAFIKGGENEN